MTKVKTAFDLEDDIFDAQADEIIQNCVDLSNPQSFFLLAGAGSGKTRSLVNALDYLSKTFGKDLFINGKRVAVITYTNAARDEILRRVGHNPLFLISTIHSFAWELINPYVNDIRVWLNNKLIEKIKETEASQSGPRVSTTSKAYQRRAKEIEKYKQRLDLLPKINKFIYSPDGNNSEKNSLNHAEVIKMTAELLESKDTLQRILIDRFPILLIDECQDTKADLLKSFISVQQKYQGSFSVGLFGDTMQRIYLDGLLDLVNEIPEDWALPTKKMNHRSQKRIVDLCNSIRTDDDGFEQKSRHSKNRGIVRVFIANRTDEPLETEKRAIQKMVEMSTDELWCQAQHVKFLTIEHDMAAKRLGFFELFEPLYSVNSFKTSVLDGTLSALRPFLRTVLPLWKASKNNDDFEIMKIVRENSSLYLHSTKTNTIDMATIETVKSGIKELIMLWEDDKDPTCMEILKCIVSTKVFDATDDLKILITTNGEDDEISSPDDKYVALEKAMNAPFSQVSKYADYIDDLAWFSTHQGVKGLEYKRVAVVIDDAEAEGFTTFSYDKLFGIKEKSETDLRNERAGKETTLDRTRRLLYVTCSRAEEGLAIIYYTDNVRQAEQNIKSCGWFAECEICKI